MIKAKGVVKGKETLVLGLADGNIERLRNDEPILFDATPYGVPMQIMIMWGETEMDMAKKLGMSGPMDPRIKPDTKPN